MFCVPTISFVPVTAIGKFSRSERTKRWMTAYPEVCFEKKSTSDLPDHAGIIPPAQP